MEEGSIAYVARRSPFPAFLSHYYPLLNDQAILRIQNTNPAEEEWLAIEAWYEGQLIGLALTECYFIPQTAQLYTFTVREQFRNQGIGHALLSQLETALKEKNTKALGFEYEKSLPATPALEKILKDLEWSDPYIYMIRCLFNAFEFNPPWIQRPIYFPAGFELFSWKELQPKDKEHIDYMRQQGHFLPYLSPFKNGEKIHYPTSFGLRHQGKIIGWSITHLLGNTLRYSSLYIASPYRNLGLSMRLAILSIQANKATPIPYALIEFNLQGIDPTWRNFMKKKLMPLATKVERWKWAFKAYK